MPSRRGDAALPTDLTPRSPTPPQSPVRGRGRPHVRNIGLDIVLSFLTCGLFNLVVQRKQMQAVNAMLGEEKYSFITWLLLCIVTCGLYHIYHEYRFMRDIAMVTLPPGSSEPIACLALAFFGLTFVADAIQQTHINRYYGSRSL